MLKKIDINLLYRFIGLLLFLLIICYINNVYILTILFFGIFVLNKKYNPFVLLMASITLFFLIIKFINNDILLINVMLCLDYIVIFFTNIKKDECIKMKNIILGKKYTYKNLAKEYNLVIKKNNEMNLEEYLKNNNLSDNGDYLEIRERLINKNKTDVFNKLTINYLRFYKNQNDRYKYLGFNLWTMIYLIIQVILLIIAVVI